VLIIVVVVVAMLSLAGLSFVATMHSHRKAVHLDADRLRLVAAVGSGIEAMKAFFEQSARDQREAGGSRDNSGLFRDVSVLDDKTVQRRARFSVVSPQAQDGQSTSVRFGTENESARLNLGALIRWDEKEPGAGRRALMSLPGMTEAVADSILDWVDPDTAPRQFGAEADHYEGLGLPYSPRNGVPQCLEELLLVRGVTRELLFGGDPRSSGQQPWAALVTVASAERNENFDGRARIHLNEENLSELQRRLSAVFDRRWGDFILAYRQFGPYQGEKPATSGASVTIDPSKPAKVRIESPLDLIGAKVLIPAAPGADEKTAIVLGSPLTGERMALRDDLAKLLDYATVLPTPVIPGRINVNLAPRAVLRAVPGMDSALAERVLAARNMNASGDDPARRHPAWLLTEGIVDLPRMKALLPYITTGGDVHRAQVIGSFDDGGRSILAEAVVDASIRPARQIYYRERGSGFGVQSSGLFGQRSATDRAFGGSGL
jgi:type II secretory pathway component PulK